MKFRNWLPLALVAAAAVGVAVSPATRADDPKPDDPAKPAETSPLGGTGDDDATADVALDLSKQDPTFDRFVDLDLFLPAVRDMDAATLVDISLQLAEGERALGREHKVLSSKTAALKAAAVALMKNDTASFDRLAKVTETRGDKDLAAKLAALKGTGAVSRAVGGLKFEVATAGLEPTAAESVEGYVQTIKSMVALADVEGLDGIAAELAGADFIPDAQRKALTEIVSAARKAVVEAKTPADDVLQQLSASSRGAYKIGQRRPWELRVGIKVGNRDGWRSNESVYSPQPGWVVDGPGKVSFSSRYGHTDYSTLTTRRNWSYLTTKDVTNEYSAMINLAAKYKKLDIKGKLQAEEREYSGYTSRAQTSHASIIAKVSAKGQGTFSGGSSINMVVRGTETYVGTKADLAARAKYWKSYLKK